MKSFGFDYIDLELAIDDWFAHFLKWANELNYCRILLCLPRHVICMNGPVFAFQSDLLFYDLCGKSFTLFNASRATSP